MRRRPSVGVDTCAVSPAYRPPGTLETGSGIGLGLARLRQAALFHGGEAPCLGREGGVRDEATLAARGAR
jgi:hypothetical protein